AVKSLAAASEKITITASNSTGSVYTLLKKSDKGQSTVGAYDLSFLTLGANDYVQLYTLKENTALAINTINTYEAQIPVGVQTAYSGTATLNFKGMDTWNANIVLIDKLLNKKIDLTGKASVDYSFESAGNTADRFVIATSKTPLGLDDITAANAKVQTYVQDRIIHVVSPADNPVKSVEVYNLNGAVVNAKQALPAGVYVVKVAAQKGTETVKVIVK
ncbi:MAG: T9SS type A sorting domain-containing protein, partial [Prevotellaceae bacterium]|nr:T9SS type A sorting domain-containing protein [Prevotellaceae bacterium]